MNIVTFNFPRRGRSLAAGQRSELTIIDRDGNASVIFKRVESTIVRDKLHALQARIQRPVFAQGFLWDVPTAVPRIAQARSDAIRDAVSAAIAS